MSTSLDDRSDLPPPPGLFDLGLVDEQEAGVEPIAGGLDDAEAERRWWNRAPKADPSAPVPPLTEKNGSAHWNENVVLPAGRVTVW